MKTGRNDPCHCGSGEKYKRCHLPQDEAARSERLAADLAARTAASQAEADAEAAEAERSGVAPIKAVEAPKTSPAIKAARGVPPIRPRKRAV